jgi:hypothetical protein
LGKAYTYLRALPLSGIPPVFACGVSVVVVGHLVAVKVPFLSQRSLSLSLKNLLSSVFLLACVVLFVSVSVRMEKALFCPVPDCPHAKIGFARHENGLTPHLSSHVASKDISLDQLAKEQYQICQVCLAAAIRPKFWARGSCAACFAKGKVGPRSNVGPEIPPFRSLPPRLPEVAIPPPPVRDAPPPTPRSNVDPEIPPFRSSPLVMRLPQRRQLRSWPRSCQSPRSRLRFLHRKSKLRCTRCLKSPRSKDTSRCFGASIK